MTAPTDIPSALVVEPSPARDRVAGIDILRGAAILGILLMNIQSFAMPVSAYTYPWSWGDLQGVNGWVHFLIHIVASGKFISIFAMLFGAGIILQQQRFFDAPLFVRLHFRRMFGLLAIGLLHAYLLWYGDILFSYALLGMLAFCFRHLSIKPLLWIGAAFFLAGLVFNLFIGAGLHAFASDPSLGLAAELNPGPEAQLVEVAIYQGPWLGQLAERATYAFATQTWVLATYSLPFVTGMMLIGMALMKSGFYTGAWSTRHYVKVAAIGTACGWGLSLLGLWLDRETGRDPVLSVMVLSHLNTIAMIPTALGYSAVVLLLASHRTGPLAPLAAVGRTALSCYLLETLLCTTIFYGHGLGYFGKLDRVELLGVVVGVWVVLLIFANLWLRHFRYGPAEWIWRRMTYGASRLQAPP